MSPLWSLSLIIHLKWTDFEFDVQKLEIVLLLTSSTTTFVTAHYHKLQLYLITIQNITAKQDKFTQSDILTCHYVQWLLLELIFSEIVNWSLISFFPYIRSHLGQKKRSIFYTCIKFIGQNKFYVSLTHTLYLHIIQYFLDTVCQSNPIRIN
jgi:hypothetical protein